MPLLDFSEYRGSESVIGEFLKAHPELEPGGDVVNSVVLSRDGKEIHVFLYEDTSLPKTFKGLKVEGHI